ncbi:MAG: GtrA family protein [Dehalococcoidia bacterium]|nr:GtrA family protein [Dehalococcoidia bacterium]
MVELIRRLWSIQFLRFLAVGGLNTVFGYSVFALFIWLGLEKEWAALASQICGVLFNFRTTGTIVFNNKDWRLIFRFFGVYLLAYLLNIGLLNVFAHYGVGSYVAGAIIILPVSFLTFLLHKRFVFKAMDKTKKRVP